MSLGSCAVHNRTSKALRPLRILGRWVGRNTLRGHVEGLIEDSLHSGRCERRLRSGRIRNRHLTEWRSPIADVDDERRITCVVAAKERRSSRQILSGEVRWSGGDRGEGIALRE